MVQLVRIMKVMTKRGKAGEARGFARHNDVSKWRGSTAWPVPVEKRAPRGVGAKEFFFYHNFEIYRCGLPVV